MKYYAIPPIPNVEDYDDHEYHMVIGPLIPKNLYEFYKDKTTIVDNGEYEGKRCDVDDLFRIANRIDANEVVLPDEMRDPKKTRELVNFALPKAESYDFKTMGVAHGNSINQVVSSAKDLKYVLEVDVVALPKYACDLSKGRMGRVEIAQLLDFPVHQLGLKDIKELDMLYSRSIDTSYPFKVAQKGKELYEPCPGKLNFNESVEAREYFEKFMIKCK